MSDVIGRATAARRLSTWVLAILAILGLVLALLGIYGTTSNAVAQRTREIAVRMALGANQFEVLRSCMLSALRSTVLGLTIGICSTPLIAQLFAKLLYGTSPLQSGVYALVSGLICMASLVAAYRPASRASRIDPIEALRWE